MRSAIIATVLNELLHVREFLASVEAQSRHPDVVVITDGGSTDGTQDVLQDFASSTHLAFRWELVQGNRSRGRNAAIRLADADAIAVTDVNVLEPQWFERIVGPLERGEADVVAGWYEPIADTARERAMGLMTLYSLEQIDTDSFVPASRSIAFTRAAWERVRGYEERLDMAEDTYLVLAMRRAGLRFVFEPSAVVRCWTSSNVREAFRTYRQYAYSDGRARLLGAPQTHYAHLYGAYGVGFVLVVLGFWWPLAWIPLIAGAMAYVVYRIRKVLQARLSAQMPYSIVVALAVDLAQMVGYAEGRAHPIAGRPGASVAADPSSDP
ncbi:MAG TPA: glycosyltransferase [Thermoplasmata archaeon]